MLQQARDLLNSQYNRCIETVKNDVHYTFYAKEKIKHSLQVAGAGNYLIKHISWLQNKPSEYIETVQTAVLLHDVCRFSEIISRYQGQNKYDHGIAAYDFLRERPPFTDIRIRLSIKHHGHQIADLYNDAEYQNLPQNLRNEVQKICFLVRDADKIANFYLITREPLYWPLFVDKTENLTAEDLKISDNVKQLAFIEDTLPFPFFTIGDRIAGYLSWYLDINYQAALDYCAKTGTTELMFKLFSDHCSDEKFKNEYIAFVRNFLQNHKFIK